MAQKISKVRFAFFIAISTVVLITPALWNGFPLIFPDSAGYIEDSTTLSVGLPRAIGYALFIRPFVQWGDLWGVVVTQSLISLIVLWIFGIAFRAMETWFDLLVIVAALALSSTLSWTVSWILPDIFSGLMIASLAALAALEQGMVLRYRWPLVCLAGAFSILHSSNILVLAVIGGALVVLYLVQHFAALRTRVQALAVAAVVGVGLLSVIGSLALNVSTMSRFSVFSPHGINLILANLVGDGHLRRYLQAHCPDPAIKLCDHTDSLTMDATTFLWASDSPFTLLGAFGPMDREAELLVLNVVIWRPIPVVASAVANFFDQLRMLDVRNDMKFASSNPGVRSALENHRIRGLEDYPMALQHGADFPSVGVVRMHQATALLGTAAIALYLLMFRERVTYQVLLALFVVFVGILGNALVSGALSVPQDRYNTRVFWLIPACAILLWWPRLKKGRQWVQ